MLLVKPFNLLFHRINLAAILRDMKGRITLIHQGQVGAPDNHAVIGRNNRRFSCPQGIGNHCNHLVFLDFFPQGNKGP